MVNWGEGGVFNKGQRFEWNAHLYQPGNSLGEDRRRVMQVREEERGREREKGREEVTADRRVTTSKADLLTIGSPLGFPQVTSLFQLISLPNFTCLSPGSAI